MLVGDLDRPAPVAQERDVGIAAARTSLDSPAAASASPPPWLPPVTTSRSGSTSGCCRAASTRQHRVGDEPAVVVRGRARIPRVMKPGYCPVAAVGSGSGVSPGLQALPWPRVSMTNEAYPADAQRSHSVGYAAPAAVADVLDDRRQRAGRAGRREQPRPDRLAGEPRERHVVDGHGPQRTVDRGRTSVPRPPRARSPACLPRTRRSRRARRARAGRRAAGRAGGRRRPW